MKLTADPFTLIGQVDEVVSVDISSTGTTHSVVYELNRVSGLLSLGKSLTFKLIYDPTVLNLAFSFTGPQGGVYLIRIAGGPGISEYTLKQTPNPGLHASLTYVFQVEGGQRASAQDLGGDETKKDYE